MNAAFLLVTGAILVGQGGDNKPAPPPAAPAVASSCGHDRGCDGFGHRLRDKLCGLFNRDKCDPCPKTTACCHEKHARTPLFHSRCEEACKPNLWKWEPACREKKHCVSTKCHDDCDRGSLLDRLRGVFHRDRCCDSGSTVPVKSGEKIGSPKKMPEIPKDKEKSTEEVRIVPQPAAITPNAIPAVPSVQIVPTPVPSLIPAPRVEGDRRDPF
ncbi:MAG: hypothetical protein EXR98_03260 [Gemmataceae bacterium]|nr:hypothetical protein [Gemmataceae bacterium]